MVRVTNDNKVYVKILFWGIKGAGKNTAADLLYDAVTEEEGQKNAAIELKAVGERTHMPIGYEEGLFSDRGIFQSTKRDAIFFHVYTFTGDPNFSNKMPKSTFKGTDSIVFVFDAQRARLNENAESLSLLKAITGSDLIEKIPMTVLLTKTDTTDAVSRVEVEELLRSKGLMLDSAEPLSIWNPMIIEANLHDEGAKKNVYKAFTESARRAGLYQTFGSGAAPAIDKNTRINLIIPEALKTEWERFSSDVVHASMSQMIRDAVRDYMQKKEQPDQPPTPEPVVVQNDLLEKRIEAVVTKKLEELLMKHEGDIVFNKRKYPEAVKAYLEIEKMDNKEKVLPDLEKAEVIMKLAYSYINVQDFNNAKLFLQEAKRIYTLLKKEAEIKIIDSTLIKLNSSKSGKD